MTGTRRANTGIVAHGRIYFAADNKVYAFTAPPLELIVRQISGSTNALWDFSILTNGFQDIELNAEKTMDAGTNSSMRPLPPRTRRTAGAGLPVPAVFPLP